jgi:hypothetical protein
LTLDSVSFAAKQVIIPKILILLRTDLPLAAQHCHTLKAMFKESSYPSAVQYSSDANIGAAT